MPAHHVRDHEAGGSVHYVRIVHSEREFPARLRRSGKLRTLTGSPSPAWSAPVLWIDADDFEGALAKLDGVAFAIAGDSDDSLGDDLLNDVRLSAAVQRSARAFEGFAHETRGVGVEGGVLEEGHNAGHGTLQYGQKRGRWLIQCAEKTPVGATLFAVQPPSVVYPPCELSKANGVASKLRKSRAISPKAGCGPS